MLKVPRDFLKIIHKEQRPSSFVLCCPNLFHLKYFSLILVRIIHDHFHLILVNKYSYHFGLVLFTHVVVF